MDNKFIYIDTNKKNPAKELYEELYKQVKFYGKKFNEIAVLCIGSDKVTGDSLGPLIGHKLNKRTRHCSYLFPFSIYGTLENPVHANNLSETVKKIYENHEKPLVIAVDACLGKPETVGYLQLGTGSVNPGAGVKKNINPIGDIFIMGIVNSIKYGEDELSVLQYTRLHLVMKMADIIVKGLFFTLKNLNNI